MNKMTGQEVAPKRTGGLRRRNRGEGSPFNLLFRDGDGLLGELDHLLEDFWLRRGRSPALLEPWELGEISPSLDQTEDDKAYHVSVELPGMDQADVDVSFADGRLTISGEKKQEKEEKDKDFYRCERSFGEFRRSLAIPGAVDESKIEATFKKGVLNIHLPKTKEAQSKPRKIAVKAAG